MKVVAEPGNPSPRGDLLGNHRPGRLVETHHGRTDNDSVQQLRGSSYGAEELRPDQQGGRPRSQSSSFWRAVQDGPRHQAAWA